MQTIKRKKTFIQLVKTPIGLATIIFSVIVIYVTAGSLLNGASEANGTPGEVATEVEEELFLVSARQLNAQDYIENVQVRGRTEALKSVALKAEVSGKIVSTPVFKGDRVRAGQTICEIAPNAKKANLAKAAALATQRQLQYNAALELSKKGFRSDTQVATAKAELDSANAGVRQAQVELDQTSIKAPFAGLVNERPAELGDLLQVGGTCAVLLTDDPYLVVGEVSDRQVGRIKQGQSATVELTTGETLEGKVRYVSSAARLETRTFRVEIEVRNPELNLRDGITANILIPVESAKAHFLTPSLLTLKDDGAVGIRIVEDDTVKFYTVTIAGNDSKGLWVKGLPDSIQLIITGQNFVTEGQKVRVELHGKGDK